MRLTAWVRTMRGKVAASLGATALAVAGVVGVGAGTPAIALADGYGQGDGLHRYVVTLSGAPSVAPAEVPTAAAPAGPAASADATRVRGGLDLELLAQAQRELGPGGGLEQRDGLTHYVTAAGSRVVSPGAGDVPVPAPGAATDAQPVLDALAAHPGIDSAQWIHDGQALLATGLGIEEVRRLPGVLTVTESVQVPVARSSVVPNDPYFAPYGWNLRNTGANAYQLAATAGADVAAPAGWLATRGQGAVVAVVDTGFDSDHPDLAGVLWNNPTEACGVGDTNGNGKAGDCHGWNFYTNSADVDNGSAGSHGTTVSGVIAANFDNGRGSTGLAPGVRIMPLVVGGGSSVDVNLAAQAIRYAADNGADVVNGSFGGAVSGATLTALRDAVDYAIARGVVVVVAAGNDAGDRDVNKVYPASLESPALLTVGSSTPVDVPAASSAYGATSVDLFAPGERIVTTWNDGDYRLVSGTSIASPHVAAAAAMHLSLHPDLTPAQVREQILADAVRLPSLAGRAVSGGRLTVGTLRADGATTSYVFSGMVARPGTQTPTVAVTSTAPAGTYQVAFGLAMLVDHEVWAVAGEDVTFDGQTKETDDTGVGVFDLGALEFLGSPQLSPTLTLGEGQFALTVQVLKDGAPLTRPYAAPLVVSASAGGTQPGGSVTPGPGATPTPPGASPGGGAPTDPGTTDPGATDPGTTDPGATGPGTTQPGGGAGGAPGGTDPGSGGGTGPQDPGTGGSAPGGGTDPGSTDPGGTDPGSTDPGTPGPGDPGPRPPAPSTAPVPGGGSGPSVTDEKLYDAVGAFEVTSIGPVHVGVAGGDVVRIRGRALEAGVGVRVGATGTGDVLLADSASVVFVTPPRVAGVYDVTVYKNGRSSVLPGALVYGDGGSTPSDPGDSGTGPGGTDPGTGGPAATPAPGATPTPGGTGPGGGAPTDPSGPGTATPAPSATPGPSPSATPPAGGTTPTTPSATRTGPNGERLVRNDALASLRGLWSVSCTATCSGTQV